MRDRIEGRERDRGEREREREMEGRERERERERDGGEREGCMQCMNRVHIVTYQFSSCTLHFHSGQIQILSRHNTNLSLALLHSLPGSDSLVADLDKMLAVLSVEQVDFAVLPLPT